jgi:hypothetical protein
VVVEKIPEMFGRGRTGFYRRKMPARKMQD